MPVNVVWGRFEGTGTSLPVHLPLEGPLRFELIVNGSKLTVLIGDGGVEAGPAVTGARAGRFGPGRLSHRGGSSYDWLPETPAGARPEYFIHGEGRLAAGLGPFTGEWYGPLWEIRRTADPRSLDPVVIVTDPGDGSAIGLAREILGLLNSGRIGRGGWRRS